MITLVLHLLLGATEARAAGNSNPPPCKDEDGRIIKNCFVIELPKCGPAPEPCTTDVNEFNSPHHCNSARYKKRKR